MRFAAAKKMKKNKKGFTLIEILIIVIIIGILVSIVIISLMNAKTKSQDMSAFTSFKSIASPAFMCLDSGITGVRLSEYVSNSSICSEASVVGDAVWPDFSKYGWGDVKWCFISDEIECSPYNTALSCGANNSGDFCFMLEKDLKKMVCTVGGCFKYEF
jgi:type IV pilus assembly protein PilA